MEGESLVNNEVENDLEIILDEDQLYVEGAEPIDEANDVSQGNSDSETKKDVKPKRVIKNPQPKLNEQTLKEAKGLSGIEGYFERLKFKGRGYEEQDLNVILKTYEYWCHRLFPKFPFESCVARLEKLGTKRATQVQIKKIRMGLEIVEAERAAPLNDEEVNDTTGFVDTYNDNFDQLVSTNEPEFSEEQMERMRQNLERAKRLREEKKRNRVNSQNNVDINSIITQNTGVHDNNSKIKLDNVQSSKYYVEGNIEVPNQVDTKSNKNIHYETNSNGKLDNVQSSVEQPKAVVADENNYEGDDCQVDIDNILDYINSEKSSLEI